MGRVWRLALMALSLAVGLRLLGGKKATEVRSEECGQTEDATSVGYDVRVGAAAYAPIIGTIGGFVVTAVVLVFEIVSSHNGDYPNLLGRATSFLVLGLIACLLGAFALAAIGAEQRLTPELPPATLYAGATTAIGVVAIMAAFEVLAAIYLPETKSLFALLAVGTSIGAVVMVALALGDAWMASPDHHWLGTKKRGYRWGTLTASLTTLGVVIGALLYFLHCRVAVGPSATHWFVGVGIIAALAAGLGSMFRTMQPLGPLAKTEALFVLGLLTAYLVGVLVSMP